MNGTNSGLLRRTIDRALAWRDRRLLDPVFINKIKGFPLASGIARRQAGKLFDLCAGFVYSQILAACVRLDLFRVLADGPQTIAALAPRLKLAEESAARLLKAAVALELAEHRGGGRYGLGMLGAAVLANPGIARMVEHHAELYADLRDPVALLHDPQQPTALRKYWSYATAAVPVTATGEDVSAYSELMAESQALVAAEVLAAYSFDRHRCLLDMGGGQGAFLTAVAAKAPHLRMILFDLPAVAERAAMKFREAGIAGRASAAGGSFFDDPLPQGADIVSLVRVLHDHNDDAVEKILRAAKQALPPGGTLLIAEPLSDARDARRAGDAYFGFYLLAMGSGRPRTSREYERFLHRAGFRQVRRLRTRMPLITGVLVARSEGNPAKSVNYG